MYKKVYSFWWNKHPNVGDALNEYLITKIIGDSNSLEWIEAGASIEHYLCAGSILKYGNENSIVWGSGLIGKAPKYLPTAKPKEVRAVRGPLTRSVLKSNGFDCPNVYGDPAILLSDYYLSSPTKKVKIGLVPHFVDLNKKIINELSSEVKLINVETTDVEGFIDELTGCEFILSSSLHGLILADVYGIPNLWVDLRDHFLQKSGVVGHGFKFRDYFQSVYRNRMKPISLRNGNLESVLKKCELGRLEEAKENLMNSIPF